MSPRIAVAERTDDAFEAAVRRRIDEIGMSERKARFVTAIEFGQLPDSDVVFDDGTAPQEPLHARSKSEP